jgi:hypothetical protein
MAGMNQEPQRKPRRTAPQIQELASRYRQSQLSKTAFAELEGICLATLRRHLQRDAVLRSEVGGCFIEVERADAADAPGTGTCYRVCFGEGLTLEIPAGFSLREVAGLLEAVRAAGAR